MDNAQRSIIKNRALAAKAAGAPEVRPLADVHAEVAAATEALAPAVDATPKARAKADAAKKAAATARGKEKRTAIITNTQAHVQFLKDGPADVLALLDANDALTRRNMVLEAHQKATDAILTRKGVAITPEAEMPDAPVG